MTAARTYRPHYTVADYRQWLGDWELWFGTAVAMTPSPFAPHERIVSELAFQLQSSILSQNCDCCLYTGLDWIVQSDTVVRPDIMVVCGPQPSQYLQRPPQLIVEVLSPATAEKDLGPKRELYEQQRVAHYLVVDPATNHLQWYRLAGETFEVPGDQSARLFLLDDGCELRLEWPSQPRRD